MKPLRSLEYELFLRELREVRSRSGLTQVQLADALGQLQTYVSKSELGDRRLDVIELRNWLIALGGDPVAFAQSLEARLARNAGVHSLTEVTSKVPAKRTAFRRKASP